MTGLPEDPSDRPTEMAKYDADGWLALGVDDAPEPWYRNRMLQALWALMAALLLALIIYGLVELSRGGGQNNGPSSTTSSITPPSSSSTSSTAPTTTAPTATDTPPPPETPQQTTEVAPPPNSPAPAEPPQHHHHFHLPHGLF